MKVAETANRNAQWTRWLSIMVDALVSVEIWTLVAVLEIVGPLVLIVGGLMTSRLGDLMTRAAAATGIGILIGAIVLEHWGQWNFAPSDSHPIGGMEFQVNLLVIHLYFLLRGNNA